MAGIYLDTSALGRVLLAEPDATAIRSVLDQQSRPLPPADRGTSRGTTAPSYASSHLPSGNAGDAGDAPIGASQRL